MTKTLLIASVAALAITAPVAAERGERQSAAGDQDQQQTSRQQESRAERQQQRVERQEAPRAERQQQRMERQQVRVERQQAPRFERQEQRADRQLQRIERQQAPRFERQQQRAERVGGHDDTKALRRQEQRMVPADSFMPGRSFAPSSERAANRGLERPQEQAERQQHRAERQQQRFERQQQRFGRALTRAPLVTIGQRIDPAAYTNTYMPLGYRSTYVDSPEHFYRYDDGYMYQVRRNDNVVSSLMPLLGGAFSVGQPMPYSYRGYNVPSGYSSLYYNTPDSHYGYGGGAIYQVDPNTQLIQSVVQLLSGNNLGVGQLLPSNYGVYNVPDAYRDRYYDTADSWYRYNDGYIYQVDPYSRRIEDMYPAYYGGGYGGYGSNEGGYYGAGSAFPLSYADYNVPYGYRDLYYDTPQYDYRYANGGIYQLDAGSQIIRALVALVNGRNFGIGQVMPSSYGVYNVPDAYRDRYYDSADSQYRYNDSNIYQIEPRTRVIERVVPVSYRSSYGVAEAPAFGGYGYDGYLVGATLPDQYADYNVPYAYRDVYYDTPQYDYRFANGAIYQVDPQTRVIQALVALVGGEGLGMGQSLPAGYGVYNVPDAYRDRYADSDDSWYRYADGYVYQVDPRTRIINGMFDVV